MSLLRSGPSCKDDILIFSLFIHRKSIEKDFLKFNTINAAHARRKKYFGLNGVNSFYILASMLKRNAREAKNNSSFCIPNVGKSIANKLMMVFMKRSRTDDYSQKE
ncbi:hypothetical protein [Lelliottia amnigena]|uniref:hypothetical protein n=1 Tax=Lelliottia amnigena TaxID=61646 RepID=UPI0021DA7D63|nr:hypothetical protein [Lelliottia amnigena]MCU7782451.1 hypothetical protein [Lelliottia amnigena]